VLASTINIRTGRRAIEHQPAQSRPHIHSVCQSRHSPQIFPDFDQQLFTDSGVFPGAGWSVLSEPVPEGAIHCLRITKGIVIPLHTHPTDEFVYIVSATMEKFDEE